MRFVTPLRKREFTTFVREFQNQLPEGSESAARSLVSDALVEWQRISFPAFAHRTRRRARAEQFAAWLAKQDFLEGAYWLSSAYAHLAGDIQQQHQMFFTPPPLAERLITNLLSNGADITAHRFIDPACGGAAFLAPIAVRMRDALTARGLPPAKVVSHIREHVTGIELDPFLAQLSNQFLRMALYSQLKHRDKLPTFAVTVGDARELCAERSCEFDVAICNPPYRKMKASEVEAWRAGYGELIEGQPNLYGLFFKVSLNLLGEGGLAGLLTPTSYLSGQYFSRTRTFVLGNADTVQLDIFSGLRETLFLKVEQEVAITVLRKHEARKA
ncbi:MAG: N-6 DNA methylase, partial [Thermomicrobiales bacterium]